MFRKAPTDEDTFDFTLHVKIPRGYHPNGGHAIDLNVFGTYVMLRQDFADII